MGRHLSSRYLRELDFAKFYHYSLIGIYDQIVEVKQKGGSAFQNASFILYHQNLSIFKVYKIETKIVWWDENSIYLEQKFLTLEGKVCLTVLSKQRFTKVNVVNLIKKFESGEIPPNKPKELDNWIKTMEISSKKLRKLS